MGKHRLFDLAESPIHDTPKNKEQAGESQMLKCDRRGNREKREKNAALLFAISSYFIGCYKMRTAIESYLRLWLEHIMHVCTAENVLFHLKIYISIQCSPSTHKEVISLGVILGIYEDPTQMMDSLEQLHVEGHRKGFFK